MTQAILVDPKSGHYLSHDLKRVLGWMPWKGTHVMMYLLCPECKGWMKPKLRDCGFVCEKGHEYQENGAGKGEPLPEPYTRSLTEEEALELRGMGVLK